MREELFKGLAQLVDLMTVAGAWQRLSNFRTEGLDPDLPRLDI